jgi:hypothetical protein
MTMKRRLATILCLLALGLSVSACSKCGWFLDGNRACKSDVPR